MKEEGPCLAVAGTGAPAQELARRLSLPLERERSQVELLLEPTPQGLCLREGPLRAGTLGGPLRVDLLRGPLAWRLRHGGGRGQAVARAVGLRDGGPAPYVVDATAGLGRDAVLLAWLGCRVLALERSPVVHALLADGLRRAAEAPGPAQRIAERLELVLADALDWLAGPGRASSPDVVYLDPMHPERPGSARTRKEMRYLGVLVGGDPDARELAEAARAAARVRAVVKRPRRAPPLLAGARSQVLGRTTRFDVYGPLRIGSGEGGILDALGDSPTVA